MIQAVFMHDGLLFKGKSFLIHSIRSFAYIDMEAFSTPKLVDPSAALLCGDLSSSRTVQQRAFQEMI